MTISNPTNELLAQQFLIELFGTFFFIGVILVVTTPENGIVPGIAPLAIGLALAVAIYFGGFNTGGAFNPGVSLALAMRNSITWYQFLVYIIAQFSAAALVFLFWKYILNSNNV